MKALTPTQRLIVAADFRPGPGQGRKWARDQVLALAKKLSGTGVTIKVNSVLRACGYDLIHEIQAYGLSVFADLKHIDIPQTLGTDGAFLLEDPPELLTVMCSTGKAAMTALKKALPNTEVLGVTILTSMDNVEAGEIFRYPVTMRNVCALAKRAEEAGVDGIICAPTEAAEVRKEIGPDMTINTPAIRPTWSLVAADDQNRDRIMTPAKAMAAGADRIVIGRPVVEADDPRAAVLRTIDEIATTVGWGK